MKAIGTLMAFLVAGIAYADIDIEFDNTGGTVTEGGSGGTVGIDVVLAQLIWTASVPTAQAGIGGALGTGEVLLDTVTTTLGMWGTWGDQDQPVETYLDSDVGGVNINNGYFFVRLFDIANTAVDDYYLQWESAEWSPALTEYNTEPRPTQYLTDTKLFAADIDEHGNQVIPEPAVAGLIGIFGAGMIFARRMFSIGT